MGRTITPEEFADRMARLSSGDFYKAIKREATEVGIFAKGRAVLYATQRLHVRSGRLRSSIAYGVKLNPRSIEVQLHAGGHVQGEDVPYARIQDLGGRIVPKRAKRLAIPAKGGPAETASGDARRSGPRSWGELLRVHRFETGGLALVSKTEPFQIYYWLVKSVRIKPKYYLSDAFDEAQDHMTMRLRSVAKVVQNG